MGNHLHILQHNIWELPRSLRLTRGVVCILITHRWTLSVLQAESGPAVSIHCYLVFKWSCWLLELTRNFLSFATTKELLMPGGWEQAVTESPRWLFMESSWKNKVNKTWKAEPHILIICLWLWSGRGNVAKMREAWRHVAMWREREWENGKRMVLYFWNWQTSARC